MATTMNYGEFSFHPQPIPLISYTKDVLKTQDGTPIGTTFTVTLAGQVVKVGNEDQGILSVAEGMYLIREGFREDGKTLVVRCNDMPFFSGTARVNKIEFKESNDNWVFTAPYVIELEMDMEGSGEDSTGVIPPYIQDFNEEWSVEFLDDKSPLVWKLDEGNITDVLPYQLRVTHNISAKGKRAFHPVSGMYRASWQHAMDYIMPKLGFDSTILNTGAISFTTQISPWNGRNAQPFNHVRSVQIGETDGLYGVAESWLVLYPTNSGITGSGVEDFTITTRTSTENGLTNVTIEGTIQGLEKRIYTGTTNDPPFVYNEQYKYTNASGYWKNVKGRIYYRAKEVAQSIINTSRPLNYIPVSTVVGHNITNGTISYTYEYNNRPSGCIPGALQEVIQISDNYPADVFASLVVLGRAAGPILQQISTVTAPTRQLTVDVVVNPPTGCLITSVANFMAARPYNDVNAVVEAVESDLEGSYSQVFKQSDSDQWDALMGRYNRTVTWTYMNCS